MSKNPWNPVEPFKKDTIDCAIVIKGPPCSTCEHWRPHKKFRQFGAEITLQGVICCNASIIYKDFSCYKEDENA